MIQNGCKTRVPDHTDFMNCGEIVHKHGYCEEHYNDACHDLMLLIKKAREAEQKALQDLKSLDFTSGRCIYPIPGPYHQYDEYGQDVDCGKEVIFGVYCDLHKEMKRVELLEKLDKSKLNLSGIEEELRNLDRWTLK